MKKSILSALLIIVAITCTACFTVKDKTNDDSEQLKKVYIDKNFSGIKTISTSGVFLDVNVSQNSSNETHVYAVIEYKDDVKKNYDIKYELLGSELKIFFLFPNDQESSRGNYIIGSQQKGRIDIKLGKGVTNLNAKSTSGDVSIQSIATSSLNAKSTSGDVEVENSTLDKLESKSTSGDVSLLNSKAKEIYTASTSGDVEVENSSSNIIKSRSTSGDVDVNNSSFDNLESRSTSGDVSLSGGVIKEISAGSTSGDVKAIKVDFDKLSARSTSGDVNVTVLGDVNDYSRTLTKRGKKTTKYESANQSKSITLSTTSGDLNVR